MSDLVIFDVVGTPKPQGSKSAFNAADGTPRTKESGGRAFAAWRNAVADKARDEADHLDDGPLDGPLQLHVEFRFGMPKSRRKADRETGAIPKTTAPDLDKLVRAVCDAMQAGGLITDDARIYELNASKTEVHEAWTGAHIRSGPVS